MSELLIYGPPTMSDPKSTHKGTRKSHNHKKYFLRVMGHCSCVSKKNCVTLRSVYCKRLEIKSYTIF